MKQHEFGLTAKTATLGYVRFNSLANLEKQLSKAGRLFHRNDIHSVCVFDHQGQRHLYLRKDPETGECLIRERLGEGDL